MKSFEHKISSLNDFEKLCLPIAVFEADRTYKPMQTSPPIISLQKQKSAPFGGDELKFIQNRDWFWACFNSKTTI